MSPRWNSLVRLRVVPGSVCGTLERGWLRPQVVASATQATGTWDPESGEADGAPSGPSLDEQTQAIIAVLAELARTAPLTGAGLYVELADAFLHLDVVEGDFAASSDRQLQAVASACVLELLGDAASQHEVRWQLQSGNRHLLIAAVSKAQIQALIDLATRHRLALRRVQPDFCTQWNRHAQALKPGSAVFAVASGREAVVAQVANGAIAAISSGPWLDRPDARLHNERAQRLMCGFGLAPTASAGLLDTRVDRLLATAGLDIHKQSAYVLVAPQLPGKAVAPRWTVFDREAQTS